MKFKRLISLCLLLAVLVVSFSGCKTKSFSFHNDDKLNDNNENGAKNFVALSMPAASSDECCYSIIANMDEPDSIANFYNYGDEIPIHIDMQIYPWIRMAMYSHLLLLEIA